jgi:DNA-binding SARP family transcriptional activator
MAARSAVATTGAGLLRFHDLGPLTVDRDGAPLALGGRRLVSALTLLLVHADRVVSADALCDAMWGASTGQRSSSTLDSHIWRLRNLLEPWRARGAPPSVLLREPTGYRLVATADRVDSLWFAVLADEVLGLLTDGQAERAVHRAQEALALWRGRPFAAVADEPWAQPVVARLEELRDQVRERYVEALLAVGDPERALVELTTAIGDAPLRERLWAQRMLAHHRSGRTEQALATYVEARRLLLDEIGIEPGAELRALQARILDGDPSLARPARAPTRAPDRHPVEVHLPTRLPRLIGRDRERDRLAELTATHRLVTVVGAAGCGKTRLAVDVARAAAEKFPDGVWFVDLTVAQSGAQVVATVTSALGLALPVTVSARDALRAFGRDRRMLLLLDNCEHVLDAVAGVVDELLDDGDELAVLATSREPLEVDGEVVWSLEPLAVPAPGSEGHLDDDARTAPAVELFLERLAARDGYRQDGDGAVLLQAVRICRAVDGLPLAIELAAARARAYSLDEIVGQVSADASALSRIGRGAAEHHRTVRFAVEQSYRMLTAEEAQLHRAVSVVPGPFTAGLAAALVERPVPEVGACTARLVHCSLLNSLRPPAAGRPSRFTQLATIRGHAAHAAGAATDGLVAARDRRVAELAIGVPRLDSAALGGWLAAIDDDLAAVRATLQHTVVDAPSPLGPAITSRLGRYWYYCGMMIEARQWQERALAVDDADPLDRAILQATLGGVLCFAKRPDLGVPLNQEGWALMRRVWDVDPIRIGEHLGIQSAGLSLAATAPVLLQEAAGMLETLAARTQDPTVALLARMSTLLATAHTTPPDRVVDAATHLFAEALDAGNAFVAWTASQAAADAALAGRDVETGMRWSDRMVAQYGRLRVPDIANILEVRANLLALAGDMPGAVRLYCAARAHNQRAGMRWPLREVTTELMAQATGALDRVAFEEAWQQGAHLRLADLAR